MRKKNEGIKWSVCWRNLKLLRGVNADEKVFAWKVIQDMVPVGRRIHRPNVEKRCLYKLNDDSQRQVIPDLYHALAGCPAVNESFLKVKEITCTYLGRNIDDKTLIHISFNHRDKRKVKVAVWFVVNCRFLIYVNRLFNKTQLLAEMRRILVWNIDLMRNIGSLNEMIILKNLIY